MEYLYIIDYCTGNIYQATLDEEDANKEISEILKDYGFKEDQAYTLITDHELSIEPIDKLEK